MPLRNAESLSEGKNTTPFLKKVPHDLLHTTPPVRVSYGNHNKHQLGYLKQQKFTFSQEPRSRKSKYWQSWSLVSRASLIASSGGCQQPLAPLGL